MRKLVHFGLFIALSLGVTAWGAVSPAQGADKAQVSIVGSGPGAGAFRMAGALAALVNKQKIGVEMTNRASKGFVANTRMVETHSVDYALTNGVFVYQAQNNQEKFKGLNSKNIRGVGPVATSWYQLATLRSTGIKKFMDLKGRRINYGPKGGNAEYLTTRIMNWAGIANTQRKEYLRWDHGASRLKDGNIDAFGLASPVPVSSILSASTAGPLLIISLPDKVIQKFVNLNPGYYRDTYPAGSYKGMEKDTFTTIAYTIFTVANAKVPADVVYKVTKVNYDPKNANFLINAMKSWRVGLEAAKKPKFLAQMKDFGLKVHPGAARYWKERGYIK